MTITFNKDGYDPFIDFLKGVCIILVVITHCLPPVVEKYSLFPLWGRTAVPIFFIIQAFHAFKHNSTHISFKIKKLWHRITMPFLITEFAIALFLFLFSKNISWSIYINRIFDKGYGPGEYYPWIYLQFAFILSITVPITLKIKSLWKKALFFIFISQLFELLCCIIHPQEWPFFSRSFFRYSFLIFFGYIAATKGFSINWKTILLSFFSLGLTSLFVYFNIDLSPFFFDNYQWKFCHWPCYFYIPYLFLFVLSKLQLLIKRFHLNNLFIQIGQYSYEIFLFQMFYFIVAGSTLKKILHALTSNTFAYDILYILISSILCIAVPLTVGLLKRALVERAHKNQKIQ